VQDEDKIVQRISALKRAAEMPYLFVFTQLRTQGRFALLAEIALVATPVVATGVAHFDDDLLITP